MKIIDFIMTFINPKYWLMKYPYSEYLDKKLNQLIDSGEKFDIISKYKAKIGDLYLWIENHPYASFTTNKTIQVRPSRATIRKARRHLLKSKEIYD